MLPVSPMPSRQHTDPSEGAHEDNYLILVRLDGMLQCIDLTTGDDVWCIPLEGGKLCSYEQSISKSTASSTVGAAQSTQESTAGLPTTVMLAGYRSLGTATHTYVLSNNGELVLADDHRLLNGHLLVHNMAAFNATDSNYLEVSLRCGSVLVEGLDDARQAVYSDDGASSNHSTHSPVPSGPALAIVRNNRRHTGRFRAGGQHSRHSMGAAGDIAAGRSWKFHSASVSVVDLDSPSLRMLPPAGGGAYNGSVMLLSRRDTDDLRSVSSVGNSPTSYGMPSFPGSPQRRATGIAPPLVEVFVNGTWRVQHQRQASTSTNPPTGMAAVSSSRSSSFGAVTSDGASMSSAAPLWLSGVVEESEVVKAFHYCSYFEGVEKLHEIPVRIFDRLPKLADGASSTSCKHNRFDDDDAQVYLKPDRNFVFFVGDAPEVFPLRSLIDGVAPSSQPGLPSGQSGSTVANRALHLSLGGIAGPKATTVEQCDGTAWRFRFAPSSPTSATVPFRRDALGRGNGGFQQVASSPLLVETITTSSEVDAPIRSKGTASLKASQLTTATATTTSGPQTRAADLFLQNDDSSDDDDDTFASPTRDRMNNDLEGAGGNEEQNGKAKEFFDENFEPIRLLGSGASGVVVLCRHKVTALLYAVKIVVVQSKFEEEEVLREVKLHAAVMSDNVVRYHSCWTEVITRQRTSRVKALMDAALDVAGGAMIGEDALSDDGTEDDDGNSITDTASSNVSSLSRNVGKKALMLQMEFCNTTLAARLARRRCIDRVENLAAAIQLANGVQHLHSHGIVHRDLKPTNIMLLIDDQQEAISDCVLEGDLHALRRHQEKAERGRLANSSKKILRPQRHASDNDDDASTSASDGSDSDADIYKAPYTVKVGDLGLAKCEGDMETEPAGYFAHAELHTVGVGSPVYSCPEQLSGKKCHPAGDVFSLGIVIAEMYIKPATVSERLDFLLKARDRLFPQALLETYPELKIARAMLHPTPERRLTLVKAKKRLRQILGTLVRLQ